MYGFRAMRLISECKKLPSGLLWQVKRSIAWIFPADLEGLYCLKLIDELPPAKETSELWYKQAKKHDLVIRGWYNPKDKTEAYITLNIEGIYHCIPRIYWWTPVATLIITYVLAHEVGHHVSSKKGNMVGLTGRLDKKPDKAEETRADGYARDVMTRMRQHWYYRLAAWAVKDLSEWHYMGGILDWREGQYKKAAERWYKTLILDPDNLQAGYWYRRAKEMSESKEEAKVKSGV